MIIRTYFCLNVHCKNTYDAEGEYPPCPKCGGIRVQWVPRPVAIRSEATKKIDMTVNQLVSTYGDKNYRSPRTHEAVAPRVNPVAVPGKTQRFQPAGMAGWAVDMPVDANGQPVSICAPTGVTARLAVGADRLGVKTPVSAASPSPTGSVPNYEARHNPPGGVK